MTAVPQTPRPLVILTLIVAISVVFVETATATAATQDDEAGNGAVDRFLARQSYELETYLAAFPRHGDGRGDSSTTEAWSRLSAKNKVPIQDGAMFGYEARAILSSGDGELRGAFSLPGNDAETTRFVDFPQFYVRLESAQFDLTVGRALLPVGLSSLYSPADRFDVRELSNPVHDTKLGPVQVGLTYYPDDDALSYHFLPFHERYRTPVAGSRWLSESGDGNFFALPESVRVLPPGTKVEQDIRDPTPGNWGHLLQYQGFRRGYDFFVALHYGPSIYPVVRVAPPNRVITTWPLATSLAAGTIATVGAVELYVETIAQFTVDDEDQDFVRTVFGASYREGGLAGALGLLEIRPRIEVVQDKILHDQAATGFVLDSSTARPLRSAVLGQIAVDIDADWALDVKGTYNFRDKDSSAEVKLSYDYTDNLTLRLAARAFAGKPDSEFGRWRKNDHIEAGFTYRF